jgi:hypothetical protein
MAYSCQAVTILAVNRTAD